MYFEKWAFACLGASVDSCQSGLGPPCARWWEIRAAGAAFQERAGRWPSDTEVGAALCRREGGRAALQGVLQGVVGRLKKFCFQGVWRIVPGFVGLLKKF